MKKIIQIPIILNIEFEYNIPNQNDGPKLPEITNKFMETFISEVNVNLENNIFDLCESNYNCLINRVKAKK